MKPDRPEGAFYVMVDCTGVIGLSQPDGKTIETTVGFCTFLLDNGVVAVPGTAFQVETLIRLSTAASEDDVREGMQRILTAVSHLQ